MYVLFFESDNLIVNILDVIELKQTNNTMFNSNRNFNALSYRIHSDAVLKNDNNTYHMTDGMISYVPARLSYTRSYSYDELIVIHFETANYNSKMIEAFLSSNKERFFSLFTELLSCWKSKKVGYKYHCCAIFYEILHECHLQNYVFKPPASIIEKSVNYINNNFTDKDLTIKKAAKMSYISEAYFRRLFKAEYGISPKKHIINLRMQYAVGLISTGYYSLKEVADMAGYSNYKYFSTGFGHTFGVSPSEYRYNYK